MSTRSQVAPRGARRITAESLIGLDMAPERRRPQRARVLVPLCALAIGLALAITALRMDQIRIGYALTQAHRDELRLRDELQALTVSMRQLRDPARLASEARARGFGRPERVIDLVALPAVSAAPAPDGTADREAFEATDPVPAAALPAAPSEPVHRP